MNKLERAISDALETYSDVNEEHIRVAAKTALDFIGTATTEANGDFGYAIWLAESDAE